MILRNYVHSRTILTLKIHPPLTTRPAIPPGQPPHQAWHLTRPATIPCLPPDPALHHTSPATPPGQPPHSAGLPSLKALPASSATTVSLALRCASAVLVLLQGCMCGVQVNVQPTPIFYTTHLIFYVQWPHLKFYVPPPKFYVPHLISNVPHQIFIASDWPALPQGVWIVELNPPSLWQLSGVSKIIGGYVEY